MNSYILRWRFKIYWVQDSMSNQLHRMVVIKDQRGRKIEADQNIYKGLSRVLLAGVLRVIVAGVSRVIVAGGEILTH